MPDASTEELRAFIHWYYGLRNILAGTIPLIACILGESFDLTTVIMSSVEVACITFALILCYGFKHILIIEPKSLNPFKLLQGVLQFALKHKAPLCRSAFTYWEDSIPSRLDLAKSKYGGPFSHEQVEDIKTFLRATGFIIVVSVFMIGYYTLLVRNSYGQCNLRNICDHNLCEVFLFVWERFIQTVSIFGNPLYCMQISMITH